MLKLNLQNKLVTHLKYGFGDKWAVTSYLLKESEIFGQTINFYAGNPRLIYEIASFLQSTGKLKHKNYPTKNPNYTKIFKTKLIPTKKTWQNTNSKIIAYQFDGKSKSWLKNPSNKEIIEFINFLKISGYIPIDIGNGKSLNFIINTLSNCKFFIGCPSGMAHVAMSTQTPIYIINRNFNKNYLKNVIYYNRPDINYFKYLKDFMKFFGKKIYI